MLLNITICHKISESKAPSTPNRKPKSSSSIVSSHRSSMEDFLLLGEFDKDIGDGSVVAPQDTGKIFVDVEMSKVLIMGSGVV